MRGARSLHCEGAEDPRAEAFRRQGRRRALATISTATTCHRRFKDVFWSLKLRGLVHSIQITSNSPVLPWELVRPKMRKAAMSGRVSGHQLPARPLGAAHRCEVRSTSRSTACRSLASQRSHRPMRTIRNCRSSKLEIDALSKLAGFRLIGGDFGSFEKMVGEVSTGFIHFSGHGEINDPGTGAPVFAIRLARPVARPKYLAGADLRAARQGQPFLLLQRLRYRPRRARSAASCRAGDRRCWPVARRASSAACGR